MRYLMFVCVDDSVALPPEERAHLVARFGTLELRPFAQD